MISKINKSHFNFLRGGGEMGEIMRGKNWENTQLGSPEKWPQALKFAVSTMLHTAFPNFIFWGEDYACLYNDAYRPSLGNEGKHPFILGQKGEEAWPEIWDTIHPLLDSVRKTGKPTWSENQYIPFFRNGKIEDIYWTFSYSPLFGENGEIEGVLTTCVETTRAVKSLAKLKESENDLQFAINAAELGTWDYDPINDRLRCNKRLKDWFGLPPQHEVTLEQATDAIIEKDRSRVNKAIVHALDPSTNRKYDISYTIKNKQSGEERFVRAVGRAWINQNNICYRFNGTLQDNTEQREAEKERLKLISLIETSHELIGLSDMKGNIEYANPASMQMMGWNNIQDKTVSDCVYPEDLNEAKGSLQKVVRDSAYSTEMRLWNLKTKQPFWIRWNAFVIQDPDTGEPIGLGSVSTNIEKRKANERRLNNALLEIRAEKQRFQDLVKDAPIGIGIFEGKNHCIEYVNREAFQSIEHTLDEVIGTPLFDLMTDATDTLKPIFDKAFETGKASKHMNIGLTIEVSGKKDIFYFNLNCQPLMDEKGKVRGLMVVSDNVTESVKLKHILQENEKQFGKLIEQSPVPMAIFRGKDLLIEMANTAMIKNFWRRNLVDILGKPLVEVFPELEHQKYPELLRKVIQTGEPLSEKESYSLVESDDGVQEFYVDYDYEALTELEGQTTGVMITVTDVTDRVKARKRLEDFSKELEKEVKVRTEMLNVANLKLENSIKELEATNADLESFAYVSSHDLQEPLRKIQMFISRIAERDRDNLSIKGQQAFEKINMAAQRMRRLIEDLLAFSRANTHTTGFEKKDLNVLLDEVLENLSEKIEATKAQVEIDELMTIKVIPFLIRQVFQNLIENAIKFSREGMAPQIKITSETIIIEKDNDLKLDPKQKYAHITFKDNGIGFDPQFAEKIFDVFQRLHGKLEFEGTGIGLAIVRKIIQNHNGAIRASSGQDKGAVFDIWLPIE